MGRSRSDHMTFRHSMTIESVKDAAAILAGLSRGESHEVPCECEMCLYSLYRTRPKGRGRRFGPMTFFVNWLVHRIKADYLIQAGKAERIQTPGGIRWKSKISDYDKAPIFLAVEWINQLTEDPMAGDLGTINFYVTKNRAEQKRFLKLLDELAGERRRAWHKTRPDLEAEWKQNWEAGYLCQRIVTFIKSRPEKKATKRELERHFSNKRRTAIDLALGWQWFFPSLRSRKRGKSTIFYWQPPTKEEVAAYNARVSERILAELRPSRPAP